MKTLPLHETHAALGAHFTQVIDWQVPAHYKDFKEEHQAVRSRIGIADLSYRGRIRITGPDRANFLQGLITNDVLKLTEGQGLYAAILNPKGRMLADLKIYAFAEALWVDLDREITEKTVKLLNLYKLRAKAKLEDFTDATFHFGIYGPLAAPFLEKLFGSGLPQAVEFANRQVQWNEHPIHFIRSAYTGEEGYDLIGPVESAAWIWNALYEAGGGFGIRAIGLEALECLRIEAGIPRYGLDMDESTFPPEAGLEERAISYTKGCYVGQETIARIKTYGQVHRKLMGLVLKRNIPGGLPQQKDKVFKDSEEIGFVTSAVHSPTLNQNIALAYLRHKLIQPGLEVSVNNSMDGSKIPGRVVELPFYKRNPQ